MKTHLWYPLCYKSVCLSFPLKETHTQEWLSCGGLATFQFTNLGNLPWVNKYCHICQSPLTDDVTATTLTVAVQSQDLKEGVVHGVIGRVHRDAQGTEASASPPYSLLDEPPGEGCWRLPSLSLFICKVGKLIIPTSSDFSDYSMKQPAHGFESSAWNRINNWHTLAPLVSRCHFLTFPKTHLLKVVFYF